MSAVIDVKIKLEDETVILPQYKTADSSGCDVCAHIKEDITLNAGEHKLIKTGLYVEIPEGYELQVRPRSGLALKNGISVLNSPGTIDADYRGEIGVILINHSNEPFIVHNGDRIAQLVFAPVVQARFNVQSDLSDTNRGTGGFGSTGV